MGIERSEERKDTPSPPKRASLRKTLAVYAGGNSIATAIRMLAGFLTLRVLTPSVLGQFNGVMLVLGYLRLLGVGVFAGLQREVPFCFGREEHERADRLSATAQAWALLVGGLSASVLAGIAIWHVATGQWAMAAAWFTAAIGAFLLQFETSYLQTLYRVHDRFGLLARMLIWQSIVNLVLVLFVALFQLYGLCIRSIGVGAVTLLFLWWWRPVRQRPRFVFNDFKALVAVGAPLMIVSEANSLWSVLNRNLIWQLMGDRELGLYFYTMMQPALLLLPYAINQITYPRMTEIYGRNGSVRELARYICKPTIVSVLMMTPAVALAWWILPQLIELLLPRYIEGIPAARWAILDVIVISMLPLRNIFFAVKKQYHYLGAIALGVAIYLGALSWLVRDGYYLEAFPQAMLVGRVGLLLLCYCFIFILCRKERLAAAEQT